MAAIRIVLLEPGMVLEQDIQDYSGRILYPKGTKLTLNHIAHLKAMFQSKVFTRPHPAASLSPASLSESSQLILVVEDDEDDFLLLKDALTEAGFTNELIWFQDGEQLMDFLNSYRNKDRERNEEVGIIFLDINMPIKNGFETLEEIKSHKHFRSIPVIVNSTSSNPADIKHAYSLGANSYIQKPSRYSEYLETINSLRRFWFSAATLPIR